MARKEVQVKSDIVNVVFPNSPKAYGYRFSEFQLKELGRGPLKAGDWVVVKTRDGLQVVEVASVVAKDKATERELEIATAWIVDKVSPVQWGKIPHGESPRPPYHNSKDDQSVEDLLDELI